MKALLLVSMALYQFRPYSEMIRSMETWKHGKHGKHDHDKKKKKDKWVAFNGNGQFYVDPANWNQLDFTVKACHSWAWVTVGHEAAKDPPSEDPPSEDPPKEDPPSEDPPKEDPPSEDPPSGDLLLNIPSSPVIPEFFKQLEGDDDGGDDKDHQNDIVVTFKAYLADEKLQDTVRVVEEQNEEGQYSWRLETVQGDKDHEQLDNDKEHPKPPPHHPGHPHPPHHHPKHPSIQNIPRTFK
ncbi:hypothetical protein BDF19DRAFT_183477 [Syncephalis fuscata]|nr:hypothetical protein BDF19DRAFT_183477 [Syncephalis fuscata]